MDKKKNNLYGTDEKEKVILSGTVPLLAGICQQSGKNPLPAVSWMNERDSFPGMKIRLEQEQAAGQFVIFISSQPEAVCICRQSAGKAGGRKTEIKKSGKL